MFCGLRNYFVEVTTPARSWPREGLVPFVLSKGTKTAVTRNASSRSWPLPCKTGKTWAGIILPRSSFPPAHAKTSYALQPHNPALFCPFSPEAVLLTVLGDTRGFHLPKPLFPNSLPREGRVGNERKGREGFNELFTFRGTI